MEVLTLRPGDLLYLPRGYVHQAKTVSVGTPSLHLTISISRRHTYRDLIELAVRGAIDAAAAMNAEWRRALPRDYLSFTGAVYSDRTNDSRRVAFEATVARMLGALVSNVPLDAACDQFACSNFMHERLPPHTAPADAKRLSPPNLTLKSAVRLRSRHAARLCIEDEVAVLYHHVENTTIYRELPEPAHVDFAMEAVPALDQILTSFPKYVIVGNLPLETDDQKLDVAAALVEAKLLLVK
uniref:Bifunctional lysine-specific demethylase and histidyl-hydroxylase n=2 Tax=Chrysotila carterae TaxID=13221 RepID=A0A6S9XR40_CHRCT